MGQASKIPFWFHGHRVRAFSKSVNLVKVLKFFHSSKNYTTLQGVNLTIFGSCARCL